MSLLVFGTTGQVATELRRRAEVTALGREAADLTDPEACAAAIRAAAPAPAAVINAAAYTAVDRAESDPDTADLVNHRAPAAMARACAERGIPFVHVSTDYVFDGSGTDPWRPGDAPAPLNVYGASKLAGEEAVRAAGGVHAILRVSWVFSAHGSNFVKTMRRLGAERDALSVVSDQVGGPTPAADIAAALLRIAAALGEDPSLCGTYHFAGAPDTGWDGFAREIFARAGLSCTVTAIPTSQYPTPATRPLNSRMTCEATEAAFGLARPDWRAGLAAVLKELHP